MSNGNLHLVEYCANHPLNGKCLILAGVKTLESSHEFPITSLAFPLQTDEYFATGGGPEICVLADKDGEVDDLHRGKAAIDRLFMSEFHARFER